MIAKQRVWIFEIECTSQEEAEKWYSKVSSIKSNRANSALTSGVKEKVLTLRKTSSCEVTKEVAELGIAALLNGFPEGKITTS